MTHYAPSPAVTAKPSRHCTVDDVAVYSDGAYYVVAPGAYTAVLTLADYLGTLPEDLGYPFDMVSPERIISIAVDSECAICSQSDQYATLKLTAREWIARELPKNMGQPFVLCCMDE